MYLGECFRTWEVSWSKDSLINISSTTPASKIWLENIWEFFLVTAKTAF